MKGQTMTPQELNPIREKHGDAWKSPKSESVLDYRKRMEETYGEDWYAIVAQLEHGPPPVPERTMEDAESDPQFQRALEDLPKEVRCGYDPHIQVTIAELVFVVWHEINLFNEGEETDITNLQGLAKCKRFVEKWGEK